MRPVRFVTLASDDAGARAETYGGVAIDWPRTANDPLATAEYRPHILQAAWLNDAAKDFLPREDQHPRTNSSRNRCWCTCLGLTRSWASR